jgi:hypothetical protein
MVAAAFDLENLAKPELPFPTLLQVHPYCVYTRTAIAGLSPALHTFFKQLYQAFVLSLFTALMRPNNLSIEPVRPGSSVVQPIERFASSKGSEVLLLVGHDGLPGGFRQFLVSESHVRALSLRWDQLLSRRPETRIRMLFRTSVKTISLRDENTNAIRLIMYIAHLQFSRLPDRLDFKEIVRLAEVAERYTVTHLLVKLIDGWLEPYWGRLLAPGYEEWLYVTHQFGYETEYLEIARHLSLRCRVDASGTRLLAPGTDNAFEGCFPIGALGTSMSDNWGDHRICVASVVFIKIICTTTLRYA